MELLVVVAIIGLLAGIVLTSVSGARAKGRDAKRISDLRSMAQSLGLSLGQNNLDPMLGCTQQYSDVRTCVLTSKQSLTEYTDPVNPDTLCGQNPTGPCQYSISSYRGNDDARVGFQNPLTGYWQIKSYLEVGVGLLTAGQACVSSETSSPVSTLCH